MEILRVFFFDAYAPGAGYEISVRELGEGLSRRKLQLALYSLLKRVGYPALARII